MSKELEEKNNKKTIRIFVILYICLGITSCFCLGKAFKGMSDFFFNKDTVVAEGTLEGKEVFLWGNKKPDNTYSFSFSIVPVYSFYNPVTEQMEQTKSGNVRWFYHSVTGLVKLEPTVVELSAADKAIYPSTRDIYIHPSGRYCWNTTLDIWLWFGMGSIFFLCLMVVFYFHTTIKRRFPYEEFERRMKEKELFPAFAYQGIRKNYVGYTDEKHLHDLNIVGFYKEENSDFAYFFVTDHLTGKNLHKTGSGVDYILYTNALKWLDKNATPIKGE